MSAGTLGARRHGKRCGDRRPGKGLRGVKAVTKTATAKTAGTKAVVPSQGGISKRASCSSPCGPGAEAHTNGGHTCPLSVHLLPWAVEPV